MNHVLTPHSRSYNLIELGNRIKEEGCHWHLLCVKGEHKYPNLGSWVTQYHFDPMPKDWGFLGHYLVNAFLDNVEIKDEDRFVVATDDDFFEPGLFKKIDEYDDDIIIVSMKRSNKPTGTDAGCPFGTLIAAPENMKTVFVGFEQAIIKGKILRNYRCEGVVYHADGLLLEKLWLEHMEKFRFLPDCYVYFNYLPPGRAGRWDR